MEPYVLLCKSITLSWSPHCRSDNGVSRSTLSDRCRVHARQSIDYRCADKIKVGELRGAIGAIRKVLTPSLRKPHVHSLKALKSEPLSQEMHLKILHFSSGLKTSGAVEKLLFTYLWNIYHQQIPGINLIQIGAISILLCQHLPLLRCWKDILCWQMPCRVATSENDRLHIYSLRDNQKAMRKSSLIYWSGCARHLDGLMMFEKYKVHFQNASI
jgi:hypothetical protein